MTDRAPPKIARVIDLETTDTPEGNPDAEIIEFGRCDVRLDSGLICDKWTSLACPRGRVSPAARAAHHITDDELLNAPQARELWELFFADLSDDDILVAHKADFERNFVRDVPYRWIDTFKVARVVWPDAPNHQNQTLRYWLDLPVDAEMAWPPHRALPDAYVTAHLFVRMMREKTVAEMLTISSFPELNHKITFGAKHKGKLYSETPSDYLEWIRDKSEMDESTKFSAKYWLQKRRS